MAFIKRKNRNSLRLKQEASRHIKNMNDAIRSRLNPTEGGLANLLERPFNPILLLPPLMVQSLC